MQTVVMEKGKGIHKMSVNDHACFEYLYNYFILIYMCIQMRGLDTIQVLFQKTYDNALKSTKNMNE